MGGAEDLVLKTWCWRLADEEVFEFACGLAAAPLIVTLWRQWSPCGDNRTGSQYSRILWKLLCTVEVVVHGGSCCGACKLPADCLSGLNSVSVADSTVSDED